MKLTGWLFLATVFCVTWEKIHWSVGADVSLSDVLTIVFLVAFALEWIGRGDRRFPKTSAVVLVIFAALLVVYLVGFFNITTKDSLDQWLKGMVKFFLHFLFLAAGVAYLARRSRRFYWQAVAALALGLAANGAYAVLQLLAARVGINLDNRVLSPLTGGQSAINVYGKVNGATIFRPNALTLDPNHLAVMLCIPLLSLLPVYLRLERGHRMRVPLALLLAFLFLVQLATLSRSGLLGIAVGLLVLAVPYRRKLASRALLYPLAGVAAVLFVVVYSRRHYFDVLVRSRLQTGGRSENAHLAVYDFVPQVLHSHPLFGLGLNTFSVYYEFVTGKTNWGPHSFYVALIVETGLVGTVAFFAFLRYLFARLHAARAVGRALASLGERDAARVRPLAWGMTAALAGTMAANAFYLTMQFYYFYAFAVLVLALPLVFARRLSSGLQSSNYLQSDAPLSTSI
jgi:O-antigen ligase